LATTLARLHEQNLSFVRLEPTNLPTSVGRGYKTLIIALVIFHCVTAQGYLERIVFE